MAHRSTYRPDVDGLRAVAVLLVVGCHLHLPWLAGGYVGVDVFFVISGYLISSTIITQIAAGTFSLVEFYERRVRRIYPALLVMLASTVPLAWRLLFPTEMVAYARSLLAAVFACSNTLLWSWHGYFDSANDLKPLLHTWSLGVEEQFYVAFPLVLLVLARMRRPGVLRVAIWVLMVASFVGACVALRHDSREAFFTFPLRAWELLAGAAVSQRYVPDLRGVVARNVGAALGLGCIVAAAVLYSPKTVFPGVAALLPCAGACLVLSAGENGSSAVGRVLGMRPVVFVGLISYSLYLWHWPVQVFANLRHLQMCSPETCSAPLSKWAECGVFAASMVLAALSWRFVERPFRRGTLLVGRQRMFMASAVAATVVACSAGALIRTEGVPRRFSAEAVQAASEMAFDTNLPWRWSVCALGQEFTSVAMFDQQRCLPFTPGHRHYLLLGDSHAAQLWPGMATVFPGLEIGQANVAGCNLLPNQASDGGEVCREMARYVYRDLLVRGQVDTLIVSALWRENDMAGIGELVEYARGRGIEVILIGPNVAYRLPLPRLLGVLAERGADARAADAYADGEDRRLDARMAGRAQEEWKVRYVSFFENVCGVRCPAYAKSGVPMLLDSNHLTPAGAIRFAETMRERHQLP